MERPLEGGSIDESPCGSSDSLIPDLYHREEVCFECESDSSLTFPDGSHPFQRLHFSLPVLWECEVAAKIAMPF